jgi:hypothetical protein
MLRLLLSAALLGAMMLGPDSRAAEVTFDAGWTAGTRWRALVEWEVEVTDPSGERTTRSGVVRSLWSWDGTSLRSAEAVRIRSTPRTDAAAREVSAALVTGFDARPYVAPPPAPAPAVAEVAAPVEGEAAAAAEGASVPEPAPEVAASPEPVSEAPRPVPGLLPAGAADAVALVAAELAASVPRAVWSLDGVTAATGSPVPVELGALADGAKAASRTVDVLAFCPDVGPVASCVEVTTQRAWGAAWLDAAIVPAGSRRTTEVWIVEPDTLVPHAARIDTVVGYEVPGSSKVGTWRARVTHRVTLLPMSAPALD